MRLIATGYASRERESVNIAIFADYCDPPWFRVYRLLETGAISNWKPTVGRKFPDVSQIMDYLNEVGFDPVMVEFKKGESK